MDTVKINGAIHEIRPMTLGALIRVRRETDPILQLGKTIEYVLPGVDLDDIPMPLANEIVRKAMGEEVDESPL